MKGHASLRAIFPNLSSIQMVSSSLLSEASNIEHQAVPNTLDPIMTSTRQTKHVGAIDFQGDLHKSVCLLSGQAGNYLNGHYLDMSLLPVMSRV